MKIELKSPHFNMNFNNNFEVETYIFDLKEMLKNCKTTANEYAVFSFIDSLYNGNGKSYEIKNIAKKLNIPSTTVKNNCESLVKKGLLIDLKNNYYSSKRDYVIFLYNNWKEDNLFIYQINLINLDILDNSIDTINQKFESIDNVISFINEYLTKKFNKNFTNLHTDISYKNEKEVRFYQGLFENNNICITINKI